MYSFFFLESFLSKNVIPQVSIVEEQALILDYFLEKVIEIGCG